MEPLATVGWAPGGHPAAPREKPGLFFLGSEEGRALCEYLNGSPDIYSVYGQADVDDPDDKRTTFARFTPNKLADGTPALGGTIRMNEKAVLADKSAPVGTMSHEFGHGVLHDAAMNPRSNPAQGPLLPIMEKLLPHALPGGGLPPVAKDKMSEPHQELNLYWFQGFNAK